MKNIFLLFLICGLVLATQFPETISGTDLVQKTHSNEIGYGSASYVNNAGAKVIVYTKTMGESTWKEYEDGYKQGITYSDSKTVDGITYYYTCDIDWDHNIDEYTGEEHGTPQQYAYCWSACYYNGIRYETDVTVDDSTIEEAWDYVVKTVQAVIKTFEPPPVPNNPEVNEGDNSNSDVGSSDQPPASDQTPGETSEEKEEKKNCLPIFLLPGLLFFVMYNR